MRRALLAALMAAPLPALADCLSIGPEAEFCPGGAWTFEKYVDESVVHVAADGKSIYHMHRLREVGAEGVGPEAVFEEHAASFVREYGGEAYADVASSQGERHGKKSLEYAFTVKEWEEGNRTLLTFLIDGDVGYSFVTSGQPPLDVEDLAQRHEAAVAAFRLKGG